MIEPIFWIAVAGASLFLLDKSLLFAERRGWIYYRKVKSMSSFADVLLGSNSADPGARYLVEARDERPGEEDEDAGDDDSQRPPGDRLT